jgi:hypothetical protein
MDEDDHPSPPLLSHDWTTSMDYWWVGMVVVVVVAVVAIHDDDDDDSDHPGRPLESHVHNIVPQDIVNESGDNVGWIK